MEQKILIVDDQAVVREDLKDKFEGKGFTVKIAKDGLEALSDYRNFCPDIILLDAMIPKLHGFQVCKALKEQEKCKIPIIIMTGVYLKSNYKYEAINKYKADSYITKPFDYDLLFSEVFKLLNIQSDLKTDDEDDLHFFMEDSDKPFEQTNIPANKGSDSSNSNSNSDADRDNKEIDDLLRRTLKDFF